VLMEGPDAPKRVWSSSGLTPRAARSFERHFRVAASHPRVSDDRDFVN
jgi:hypothetical protein